MVAAAIIGALFRLLILTTALIIYGSLYPWHFNTALRAAPLTVLLRSLNAPTGLYLFRDLIVNIAIYVPFGAVAYLAFERRNKSVLLYAAPVISGCILSFGIEIAQLFTPTRNASLLDVISNTAGSGIGVIAASSLRMFLPPLPARAMHRDGAAIALLCCWAAYLFFPFFPALSRTVFAAKMNTFAASSLFDPVQFVSAAAQWFLGGRLLVAAGAPSPGALLGLALMAIPAQLLIYSRQPVLADLTGGIAGWSAFLLLGRSRLRVWANACVALGTVAVRELAPFRWQETANSFVWAPFGGMLAADWQRSVPILIEKSLYYGLAVWTLRKTGVRLAVPALAVFIACLEFAQIHLPGRTPEITDAVIVVLVGFALSIGAAPKQHPADLSSFDTYSSQRR